MNNSEIIHNNKSYWNANADFWFGTTALPEYGVKFPTEDELHLFGDVSGKKLLEICCGSGHSLKYHAERNAGELWGIDISEKQLSNAKKLLAKSGFVIEQMIEQSDTKTMATTEDTDEKTKKAKMLPISFCFKARKL